MLKSRTMAPIFKQQRLGKESEESDTPSNNLWVGNLSGETVDSDLMELFNKYGALDSVTTYSSRSYAFVFFKRVEDAKAAKDALQGVTLHGNQIKIEFARPAKPCKSLWVGGINQTISKEELEEEFRKFGKIEDFKFLRDRDTAFVEYFRMEDASQAMRSMNGKRIGGEQIRVDFLRSHPSRREQWPNSHDLRDGPFSGRMGPSDSHSMAKRPHSQLGGRKGDGQLSKVLWDADSKNLMGPNWRRPSPPLPSAQGFRPPMKQTSGSWDVYDVSQFQRDAKRSRVEASLPIDDASFPLRKMDDLGPGSDHSYGLGPVIGGGASGPFVNVQGKGRLSPVPGKVTAGGPGLACPDNDYIWRGIIAKGGTPVCQARCVPIGKGLETELPEVVNCSARTGLDMLAKHYREAIGFDIVFFLPDSEDDFASYTEFLRYLGSKNRAGVAKFDDGTTLFLVPPSEFLTKVLKVVGPERLYGVVLKLPPQVPSTTPLQPRPPLHSQPEYSLSHLKEEQALQMEYGRGVLHEDSKTPARPLGQSTMQSQLPSNAAALSQTGVALTPDLIATLASFLPTTSQSAAVGGIQPPLVTPTTQSSFSQTTAPKGAPAQIWNQDQQSSESGAPSFQQFNPLAQLPPVQHYSSIPSIPIHSAQMALGSTQFQESAVSLPQQGVASSRPLRNFNIASQSEHGAVSAPISQQYQPEVPPNTQKGYGMMHGADVSGLYGAPAFQQPSNPNVLSNQVHGANVSQPQNAMLADRKNLELPSQVQQLQSVLSGAGQGTSDVEVDKNQRYQSTLQFAANLLLQIQQQQQTNTPGGQGTGSQM